MKQQRKKGLYVYKVRENTQLYLRDLLAENEKLRGQIATMESDLRLYQEKMRLAEIAARENEALRAIISTQDTEKFRLQKQLLLAQEERHRQETERISLEKRLNEIENENRAFTEQYMAVEEQNSNLANLYVASYRLHETLNREEVLSSIQEIVINLVGSEEFGIYERNLETGEVGLISSFGKEAAKHENIRSEHGLINNVLQSGEKFITQQQDNSDSDTNLVACIPLMLGENIVGAIAIFQLLQHKPCLQQLDFELFDLLATHAATALYLTTLHQKAALLTA